MVKEDLVALQQNITKLKAEGKYKEVIENCYVLIESGKQFKDNKSLLVAYINLVASYYYIGDIEAALNSIEKHKEICDKYGDDEDVLSSFSVMCVLYEFTKDYDKAKINLNNCITLGKKLKKYNIVSNGYSNYSHICMSEENYTKALQMATIGLDMAKLHKPASPMLEIRVKLNLAKSLIGLRNFETSKSLIDEIMNEPMLNAFIRERVQCHYLQGYWYSKQKLYPEAFESLSKAKLLVESYNDIYLLKDIQEERCKLCELMGDINLAYKIQKEYISLLSEISESELRLVALKLEIKNSMVSMEKKANTDYLTGIYNRNYMETTINGLLKKAFKIRESLICIVFDLDGFKAINDEYGHLFGDEVIKKVSKACSGILRENDLFARFGGDEFVVILRGIDLKNGEKKAKQILETVRHLNIYKNSKHIHTTISIGITDNLTCAAKYFNELFNVADVRLYKAKKSGRNKICATN